MTKGWDSDSLFWEPGTGQWTLWISAVGLRLEVCSEVTGLKRVGVLGFGCQMLVLGPGSTNHISHTPLAAGFLHLWQPQSGGRTWEERRPLCFLQGSVLWVELRPPQKTCSNPNLWDLLMCNLIWKRGLCACHQVKVRSYRIGVNPKSNMTTVLLRGESGQ